ncbi:MAG: transketolase [Bacteroidetes bacterium]|jgi:transketolase|nr:transketolase [Bacteroidota bacterium]
MADTATDTPTQDAQLDHLAINTIRFLAVDAVEKAQSGHPGMPMGTAPLAHMLWSRHLKHNPADPNWPNRDRFVLSAGHGSMLLYALLHLTGYDLSMEEIKNFRQWGSQTPGHPENFETPGVETTTGPLGQGFGNAVGMAIAERRLAAEFNRPDYPIIDHYTYGICSDGDLMEGVSQEAASLAGHLGLGKLILFYDANEITIDGRTDIAFTEDVAQRFRAYGWHVETVEDEEDLDALDAAVTAGQEATDRPTLIVTYTTIGYGSPNKADSSAAHGAPLGADEVEKTREALGWDYPPFHVPDEVYRYTQQALTRGADAQAAWNDLLEAYGEDHPEAAQRLERWLSGDLPLGWDADLPTFEPGTSMATRKASGAAINALAPNVENLFGGSADLAGSNKTTMEDFDDFQRDTPHGNNVNFGVREHGMAAICNGIALHGGLRPFCATFLIFTDYLRPSLRLAALMGLPVTYVCTHDSIGLGEDGPTHQPVEHYAALRAIPNLTFIRPGDATETVQAWKVALEHTDGPVVLSLTRQGLPEQDHAGSVGDLSNGAYILRDSDGTPDLILIASGSEVGLAMEAAKTLEADDINVRVVSMPSWELFEAQPDVYREKVLPPDVTARVAVESGVTLGWERYTGTRGAIVGLNRFGASAPGAEVMDKLGFNVDNVVDHCRQVLEQ